ncbi:MAG: HDOD domain-containing protein [Verrucomicrobiota bacterium]|jgi:HD-like signal output (HDOD) protein
MEHLSNYGGRGEPLPLDTMAAIQLLDLFRDPDHDVDRIVEFISQDPALCAETLRRCNNVTFRGGERVSDVFEAVNRLGYYELYGIVAASLGARRAPPNAPAGSGKPKQPVHRYFGENLD